MESAIGNIATFDAVDDVHGDEECAEPDKKLEAGIAALWNEVFHPRHIEPNSDFFELGGNSLLGMELVEKLSERFDVQLPVVLLFQNPTPRQMAECVHTLVRAGMRNISSYDDYLELQKQTQLAGDSTGAAQPKS